MVATDLLDAIEATGAGVTVLDGALSVNGQGWRHLRPEIVRQRDALVTLVKVRAGFRRLVREHGGDGLRDLIDRAVRSHAARDVLAAGKCCWCKVLPVALAGATLCPGCARLSNRTIVEHNTTREEAAA